MANQPQSVAAACCASGASLLPWCSLRARPGWTVTIGPGPHGKIADVWHRRPASPSRRSTAGVVPRCPPAVPAFAPMRRGRLAARPARCWSPGAFGRAKITSLVVAADHPPPTTTTAPPSAAPWPGGRCRSPRRPARGRCPITWLRRPTASGGNTGGDERRPGSAILSCRGGSAVVRGQSRPRAQSHRPRPRGRDENFEKHVEQEPISPMYGDVGRV